MEQVVALYLQLGNHDGSQPGTQFEKLVAGVRNNHPEFLPGLVMSANDKKRALTLYNFDLPDGEPAANAPIAELPTKNREAFEIFERRLTSALYYKHMGEVLPPTHMIRTFRTQAIKKDAEELIRGVAPMLPHAMKTQRQNTDIGEQFLYVWYTDPATKMFVFMAQFSLSFVFIGAACRPEDHEGGEGYRPHSDDLP